MKALIIKILFLSVLPLTVYAESFSLNVRLSTSMEKIERVISENIPNIIHQAGPDRHVCVKAEKVCASVPVVNGFKISMENQCVEITPKISCNITESVSKQGGARLIELDNSKIIISQNISGIVKAQGRGAIGENVKQTVRASAKFELTARPTIGQDWTINPNMNFQYHWLSPPTFNLFNLIPITLAGKVDPKLKAFLDQASNDLIPRELRKLNLKNQAGALWQALQTPIALDNSGGIPLYLHLRPESIASSQPEFAEDSVSIDLAISGRLVVNDQSTLRGNLIALPDLGDVGSKTGSFSTNLPVSYSFENVSTLLNSGFPKSVEIASPLTGEIILRMVTFSGLNETIVALVNFDYESKSALLPTLKDLQLRIVSVPRLEHGSNVITMNELSVEMINEKAFSRIFNAAFELNLLDGLIEKISRIDLSELVYHAQLAVDNAINSKVGDLQLEGVSNLRLSSFEFDNEKITAVILAEGKLEAAW